MSFRVSHTNAASGHGRPFGFNEPLDARKFTAVDIALRNVLQSLNSVGCHGSVLLKYSGLSVWGT